MCSWRVILILGVGVQNFEPPTIKYNNKKYNNPKNFKNIAKK